MRYFVNVELNKFKNSFVADIKGKTATKKCICIPIEDNDIYCGDKTITASMVAYESDRFGHSHSLRQSVSAERLEKMSDDERKAIPYLGHMKIMSAEVLNKSVPVDGADIQPEGGEDLPF